MAKSIESGDFAGKTTRHDIPLQGDLDRSQFQDDFSIVDGPSFKDAVELEAFMNEPVLVEVSRSNDRNDAQVVFLSVNGVPQYLVRGRQKWIKRKYLENLATAKPASVETEVYTTNSGERAVRLNKTVGEMYGFRVVQDRNPKGYGWLQNLMLSYQE